MEPQKARFFPLFTAAVLLAGAGWFGLYYLVTQTLPTLGPRWLFFFFTTLAVSGTMLPLVYFFNRRFPSKPPASGAVIIRQSLWFGVYANLLIWLQLGGVLNLMLIVFIAAGLVMIEFFLRLRERSHWKPDEAGYE
ncbi:MAG TPA: hypothetical protein GYA06_08595 [Chloroflexi bacterium]|nr:hypothetical protein [Chloroflexota bacterium]HPO57885.1 hypothetical protein [Anaerolineaceae bacterium]